MTKNLRKLAKEIEKAMINIKDNATKVVNTLEEVISNDVTKEEDISLLLRFKLQRQNVTIKEENLSMCDNYWKNCQNRQCRQHQKLWRQWLNIQRQSHNDQNVSKNFDQRRKTSIAIRINNLSLTKRGKREAPQWKIY